MSRTLTIPGLSALWLAAFLLLITSLAQAQNINSSVAPNENGNTNSNFVDIKNSTGNDLYFWSNPTPSQASMARVDSSEVAVYPWPTAVGNFAPDPVNVEQNRIFPGEFLRVYPGTLAAGNTVQIEFSYTPSGTHYDYEVAVTAGAQVVSIVLADPSPTTAPTLHWAVTFDQAISGVTAANFGLVTSSGGFTGESITSVTPDDGTSSTNWTVTANSGTGVGLLGLDWVGHQTETPAVPNSFVGYQYTFEDAPLITTNPVGGTIVVGSTLTMNVAATLRIPEPITNQWFSGSSQFPTNATPIVGATGFSYTPPVFTSQGTNLFFCRMYSSSGYYSDSLTATVLVVAPPSITNQPQGLTIWPGQAGVLSIGVSGTDLQYQWYQGTAPDTSNPMGVNSSTFTLPSLTATTSFWVQISSGGLFTTNSANATVTIRPASLNVTTLQDVTGVSGITSLRDAIAYGAYLGNATVTFAPSLFTSGPAVFLVSHSAGAISIPSSSGTLTIAGPGPNLLSLSGGGTNQIFSFNSASVAVNALTLTNAYSASYGAAIDAGGNLTCSNVVFAGNYAKGGGGAIFSDSALSLVDCLFTNNFTPNNGGAIAAYGLAMVTNSTFADNEAGIDNSGKTNNYDGQGGAIYFDETTLGVVNCTFIGNTVYNGTGGAIYSYGYSSTDPFVIGSTFTGNSAAGGGTSGGGLQFNYGNTVHLYNSIVSGNVAATSPDVAVPGTTLHATNSLVGASVATIFATGQLANNGGLTPTVALKQGSVAIGAGSYALLPAGLTTDQRGVTRHNPPDIGAYEYTETPSLVVTTTNDVVSDRDNLTSLREAVTYANSLGGSQTVSFAPALAGQTVVLQSGWTGTSDTTALDVSGSLTLQGLTTSPGVTIAMSSSVQRRHLYVPDGASLTLSNLTFTGGVGDVYGGSVWCEGSLIVSGCTFTNNTTGTEGGAIQSWGGSPLLTVVNSTFTGNTSGIRASAIGAGAVSVTLQNLTITGNNCTSGTLWLYQTIVTMQNTILAGNNSDGVLTYGDGAFSAQSSNNLLGTGGSGGLANGVNGNLVGVTANLDLGPLQNYGGPTPTIAVLPGSPAADAGVTIAGLTTDQRGIAIGSYPSIGAYEYQGLAITSSGASFLVGLPNTCTVAAIDTTLESLPTTTFSVTGTLPSGVNFSSAGVFSGTPASGSSGTYPLTITANDGVSAQVTQAFTLNVVAQSTVATTPTFNTNGLGWALNGDTVNGGPSIVGGVFTPTDGTGGETRSTWFRYPLYVGGFQASFTYQDIGGGGADGTAFVIQNDPRGTTALGGGGGGLGYVDITPSVALLLDIYTGSGGPGFLVAADGNGNGNGYSSANYQSTTPVNVAGGNPVTVSLRYAGGVLHASFADTVTGSTFATNIPVNIPALVGTNTAWVGFTGSEGGVLSHQAVSNFAFAPLPLLTVSNNASGSVTFSWPAAVSGFTLQSASTLNSSGAWTSVSAAVTQANGQNQVTLSAPTGSQFYRLALSTN